MNKQLFVSNDEPKEVKFNSPAEGNLFVKPAGGLWTSTYQETNGSAWCQWCMSESFGHGSEKKFPSWLLTPKDNVKVYTIDSYQDLEALEEFLYCPFPELKHLTGLNFKRIAEKYDAIHLTEKGEQSTRYTSPLNLYGWDCECVLWLKWAFKEVEWLGVKEYKEDPFY